MAFTRTGSFDCTFTPPEDPSAYSKILATFAQDGVILVEKDENDITISGADIQVNLTQQETALFTAGKRAWAQMKCFASDDNVDISPEFPIDVLPVLNEVILSGE